MSFKILGLESSCDDTSVSVVMSGPIILSNIVIGQDRDHLTYQGVVPEIAARSHLTNIQTALNNCLSEAKVLLKDIDAIAATTGPGLIGGVIVGAMFGKALSSTLKKPFIAINHLEGHVLTPCLSNNIQFPYLLLLVSGGHCQFIMVEMMGKYRILGRTLDDAVGEAFDKVAKMMNLGFPGGPIIERMAKCGNMMRFNFPKPLYNRKNCDMSFSGLKTAVKLKIDEIGILSDQDKNDIAASFQKTVCDILQRKSQIAMDEYNSCYNQKRIAIAGGVAANQQIRLVLTQLAKENKYEFIAPPIDLCTDNAAMIAFAGLLRVQSGVINQIDFRPRARWCLSDVKR